MLEDPLCASQYGVGMTKVLDCPKAMVGRVIGKGGETIKTLQKDTGAAVQIDQNVEPCKVTISGPPQKVQAAADMVQDIINGGTPLSHMSHFNKYGESVASCAVTQEGDRARALSPIALGGRCALQVLAPGIIVVVFQDEV